MDININGVTDFRKALHAPNFINPKGYRVHLLTGHVMSNPQVDGVALSSLPAWLTSSSPVHFNLEDPETPRALEVNAGHAFVMRSKDDSAAVWRWLVGWCVSNPAGGMEKAVADYRAEESLKENLYYSGTVISKILEDMSEHWEGVNTFENLRDNIIANQDAGNIERLLV